MFHQLSVFWIFGPLPLNLFHKEWCSIDIYGGPNSIDSLIKDIMVQLPDVVLHSRRNKERDPPGLVDQILPIGLHRPAPAVAVGTRIIHITDIVDQDPAEQGPNGLRNRSKRELSSPVSPELELHPDPVLFLRQAPLCRLVIYPDHNVALFAAVVDRNTGTAILEALLYFTFPEFADKLLLSVLIIRIMEQLPDIEDPCMVIESHIQAGDMKPLILREHLEKADKITAAILLKGPAALARHIQTAPHTGIAVIVDGDAPEVKAVPVAVSPLLHGGPGHILHMKDSDPIPGIFLFTAYGKPIEEDHIFGDSIFHHFLPLLCR